ncbi:MAG: transcription repressor NadR [Vallitaleaceae bacterium]|nr:transcription repressor NadR [Vallitaleaceae bacterium]
MDGKERREALSEILNQHTEAFTGTSLAKKFGVSRQVIVQDIALLRAQGLQVISTSEGYRIYKIKKETVKRAFFVKHSMEDIEEELNTIVDLEGNVLNVVVTHPVYGEISVDMMLGSRRSIRKFMDKLEAHHFVPLMYLTGGEHLHVVEAESDEILDDIEAALAKKGFLVQ